MSQWQISAPEQTEIDDVRRRYRTFFAQAKQALATDEARAELQKTHDGSFGNTDISDFLAAPLARSIFANEQQFEGTELAWQVSFQTHVAPKMAKQRDLLEEARLATTDPEQLLSTWAAILRRLPVFVRTWDASPRPEQVPPLNVQDEKGMQDVVEAILRLHFDDVRREDYVPQAAGGASLVDFQIPEVGLFIELKMTRKTLRDKNIGEELLIDAGRYPAHPDCRAILAVVYDPGHWVKNPAGLESDLSKHTNTGVPFRCIIVQ